MHQDSPGGRRAKRMLAATIAALKEERRRRELRAQQLHTYFLVELNTSTYGLILKKLIVDEIADKQIHKT
jgi:hypothetical protein